MFVWTCILYIQWYLQIPIHLNSFELSKQNGKIHRYQKKKKKKESYKSDADGSPRSKRMGTLHGDFGYRLDSVLKEVRNWNWNFCKMPDPQIGEYLFLNDERNTFTWTSQNLLLLFQVFSFFFNIVI